MNRSTPILLVLLAALCGGFLPAQDRLTPEMLFALKRVSDPQLSPDGKHLLFNQREYDLAANRGRGQIWMLDPATGALRQLTSAGSNSGAVWSPDGRSIAFVSTRDGDAQIYTLAIDGGEALRVGSVPGGVENLGWSPDGKWFSFTSRVKLDPDVHDLYPDLPKADAQIYDDLMIRHWDGWRDGTYSHLFVMQSTGGAARDLMEGIRMDTPLVPNGGVEQIAWAPDSRAIVYTAKPSLGEEASTNSDLWLAPIEGGPHRNLTVTFPGYDTNPAFSPDGKHIAWLSMPREGYESDVNRLMVADWPMGEAHRADTWDGTVTEFAWSHDSGSLFLAADWRGTTQAFRVPSQGAEPVAVTQGRWQFGSLQVAPSGDALYALRQQTERPFEVVRIPLAGKANEGVAITDVNGGVYRKLALPKVEERWFKATDGERIHAWVIEPPDFDPAKKWPMLLYCQGGPQSQVGQFFSYRWNFHLMAARGYIVLAVNRRGLPGFGAKWNEAISGDWGGQCMNDLLSATDAMQAEPYVHRGRTAAVGASFGGYTIYWLMGHDPERRFAAMLAHCGVFNLESMALSTEELWFVNWDLGAGFWRDASALREYERFSPHRFVGNWHTPLMVIHGQRDFRVPVEQGIQAFTAAQLQGCPSRFVYFPGESHWVLGPQNGVLWQRLFFDWLDRWCKPK